MGRFSDRLARLQPGLATPCVESADTEPVEYVSPNNGTQDIAGLRPWTYVSTPYGKAHVFREEFLSRIAPPQSDLADRLGDARLQGFTYDNALYLDIEATGLSHGAGTFAFLIGVAYFETSGSHRTLVLEQLFMDAPENELPVLAYFQELLYRFDYLVSFNGKSYDLSVLQNRLVLNRLLSSQEGEIKLRPHLDLLHTYRLAYVGAFEDTKLQTLERTILKLDPAERADDIPGSLVPSMYFHYLRTGHAAVLDVVLKHNRTDVLSMVSLTEHLQALVERPASAHPAIVAYNLGRAAVRFKQYARAIDMLERAISLHTLPPELHVKATNQLITASRRHGDYGRAARLTEDMALSAQSHSKEECVRLLRLAARYRKKANR